MAKEKPRIVFISGHSPNRTTVRFTRYIGPYVLATTLRKAGFEVAVIDWFTDLPDKLSYLSKFLTQNTVMVGIASTFLSAPPDNAIFATFKNRMNKSYTSDYLWFRDPEQARTWLQELRELMRSKSPRARLVIGGAKSSHIYPRRSDSVWSELCDYLVLGEADRTIVELATAIAEGRERKPNCLETINAVSYGDCPVTEFKDADAIGLGEGLPLEVARGCAFNCKFCHYDKKTSIRKDSKHLLKELTRNAQQYGARVYALTDDCFNDRVDKVEAICKSFRNVPGGIEWVCYARADLAIKFPHTVDLMVEAGCRGMLFGIETFNHEAGRRAGKGVPPNKVKQFLVDLKQRYGRDLIIQCSFIVGLPGETPASFRATVDWLCEHDPAHVAIFSRLYMLDYQPEIDQVSIDFADFERNPKKYGFVERRADWWEHETMNLGQADELMIEATEKWYRLPGKHSAIPGMWAYVPARSLGYSHERIMEMVTADDALERFGSELSQLRFATTQSYFQRLHQRW
jgi:radical SAM superfamily enzyme YgiQ (UPF0313 family)